MKKSVLLVFVLMFAQGHSFALWHHHRKAAAKFMPAALATPPVHPSVLLVCAAPTNFPAGAYINYYRGTVSLGESKTAVLSNLPLSACAGAVDTNVVPGGTYYYVDAACMLVAGQEVCGPWSNESPKVVVPFLPTDLPTLNAPV